MKVADLAKALNVTSKELVDFYQGNGQEISSHLNTITDEQIDMAREGFGLNQREEKPIITTPSSPTLNSRVTFDKEMPVECRSITAGSLYMEGLRTKTLYSWVAEGDIIDVEYQDIEAAVRRNSEYVMRPLFIVMNEDVVNNFPQLKKMYDSMYSISELSGVITDLDVASMVATIKTLPEGAKDSLKNIAATMISDGRLDSIKKIKALDEIFDTQLTLMTELF